jgi:hypothetical protein
MGLILKVRMIGILTRLLGGWYAHGAALQMKFLWTFFGTPAACRDRGERDH